jgi:hypothetical protein
MGHEPMRVPWLDPQEISNAVLFLASDWSGAHPGETIEVSAAGAPSGDGTIDREDAAGIPAMGVQLAHGANLITNDTTISILDVAPRVEAAGFDCIFQGSTLYIPVETVFPDVEGEVLDFQRFLTSS